MPDFKKYLQELSYKTIFTCGMVIGMMVAGCIFFPDISSAFATWIGAIGGIVLILWALHEFKYVRQPHIRVDIDFPYSTSYLDKGEIMPVNLDLEFLTGGIINYGDKKVVLVDGGIRSTTKEYFDDIKRFHPDAQGEPWLGTTLDGSNFNGEPFLFPVELNPGDIKKLKLSRKENLDRDFLLNKNVEYFAVWVKEASGEIFYNVLQTPYYHDINNLQVKILNGEPSNR